MDTSDLRVKCQLEQLGLSEDLRSFIHIIKYKQVHKVQRDKHGDVVKVFYQGDWHAFEEDFEFYDYEIVIGQLDVAQKQHWIQVNEERDPLKRTQ